MEYARNERRATTETIMLDINEFYDVPTVFKWDGPHSIEVQRLGHIKWLLGCCADEGLNLEFGVFKGRTINACAYHEPENTFWGFDSFRGLPLDWKVNDNFTVAKNTRWNLDELPPVRKNVNLVKGWFHQSIRSWLKMDAAQGNIRWINIDSDLYSSALCVLERLNHKIKSGTIIHFDELCDWRYLENPVRKHEHSPVKVYSNWEEHEWKALNEWCDRYNRKVEPLSRSYSQASGIRVIK